MAAERRGDIESAGRYAIFGEIARGGMATVHYGRLIGPVGFARTVAIKRLHAQYAHDAHFVSGFVEEARLAARIRHPNVVATLDVEAAAGQLAVVMEYIAGEPLSKLMRRSSEDREPQGRIPPPIAAGIVAGALHGLHAAHEARNENGEPLGIVHRDVSPQNILVGADGIARIADFGIAKAMGRVQTTRAGQMKGKLRYMAPEQVLLGDVTARTDIYAAAVVLWEVLTGRRLIEGNNSEDYLRNILEAKFAKPSGYAPNISPALDALVMRGLERNPKLRFETARAFAVALEEAVGLATPRQIEEWVQSIAGETLARRAEELAAIERSSSPSSSVPELPTPAGMLAAPAPRAASEAGEVTAPAIPEETLLLEPREAAPRVRGRSRAAVAFAVVMMVVAVAIAGTVLRGATQSASQTAEIAAPQVKLTLPPAASETSSSARAGAGTEAAKPLAPADDRSPPPVGARRSPALAKPAKRRPTDKATPPAADCDPPYAIDSAGIRRIKPECL